MTTTGRFEGLDASAIRPIRMRWWVAATAVVIGFSTWHGAPETIVAEWVVQPGFEQVLLVDYPNDGMAGLFIPALPVQLSRPLGERTLIGASETLPDRYHIYADPED